MASPGESDRQLPPALADAAAAGERAFGAVMGEPGAPGFYPGPPGELGTWVLCVRGGGALMMNLAFVLECTVAERHPGPGREALARLLAAMHEALEAVDGE